MVLRNANAPDAEPEQSNFDLPSEGEHLFQVADVFDQQNHPENFDIDDPDIVFAKCEVVGGDEEGRTLLNRCCLDDSRKEFYFTRMFLKAIAEPYKGSNFPIDSDDWQGRQFYATVTHTPGKNGKTFANIKEYNFDKMVEQPVTGTLGGQNKDTKPEVGPDGQPISWDE